MFLYQVPARKDFGRFVNITLDAYKLRNKWFTPNLVLVEIDNGTENNNADSQTVEQNGKEFNMFTAT